MNKKIAVLLQSLVLLLIIGVATYFYHNVIVNMQLRHIASGFAFLEKPTGFDIIMHLIPYSPESTYLVAFYVGILNTLLLSIATIVLATILGSCIGIAMISKNWLLAKSAHAYVEIFRNIPLLLQVLFWYFILLRCLPDIDSSWHLTKRIYLNVRGLQLYDYMIIPELIAMLCALTIYSASYIAENIRGGLQAVDRGQYEAAYALGLSHALTLRLIVIPEALRSIIPPLASQYMNVTKNSSLSAVIGYPDLVAVFAGTALNQTGQAVETIFMVMSVYLVISLVISLFMNWYNAKILAVYR